MGTLSYALLLLARRYSGDFAILYLPHYAKSCKHDYLTHTCLAWTLHPLSIAPSIVAVDLQASLHRLHLVSPKRLCRLVDIRERIIASAAPFRSRDQLAIYISICIYATWSNSGVITSVSDSTARFNIREKVSGRLRRSPQSFSHRFIYSTNYREDYLLCHRV